jgi:hypothetical protein
MTPKDKAIQLVEDFTFNCKECDYEAKAKQCALIAVDEILKGIVPKYDDERYAFELGGNQFYWADVKKEIEAL